MFKKGNKVNLGRKQSKETIVKRSETAKRIGIGKWNKGKKCSDKTKLKMSETHKRNGTGKWNKGRKHTLETKRKISKAHKGHIVSEETKRKISESEKGKKQSEETRNKLRQYRGKLTSNWQGGISNNPYPNDWTDNLRESIRKRDNYICQECGIHQEELKGWQKKLAIHHIDYNKDNLNPDNLISLCRSCHQKTNINRGYWIKYFNV